MMVVRKRTSGAGARIAACAALLALTAGCAGEPRLTPAFTSVTPNVTPYIEIQSAGFTCDKPNADGANFAAASGLLPSFAASFVMKLGEELLQKMQEDRSAIYAAMGEIAPDCLPGSGTQSGTFKVERSARNASGGAYEKPAFELSGDMTLSVIEQTDGASLLHIRFKPTKLIYGRAAPRAGSGRKRVVLLVQFADESRVGAAPPSSDITLTSPLRIDLGYLQEGTSYGEKMLGHMSTSVVIPYPSNPTPVVTAVVFETERESVALRALSGAYSDNSNGLAEWLRDLLGGGEDADD